MAFFWAWGRGFARGSGILPSDRAREFQGLGVTEVGRGDTIES